MTISDAARERYARIGYNALAESWERELDGQDCGGVLTWEESLEETACRNEEARVMASAVAEQARKDLIEQMIADCMGIEAFAFPFVFPDELETWIRTYLPKEAE